MTNNLGGDYSYEDVIGFTSKETAIETKINSLDNTNAEQNQLIDENYVQDANRDNEITINALKIKELDNSVSSITLVKTDDLTYQLQINGVSKGEINIPKDQFLKDVVYDKATKKITFTFITSEGEKTVTVDVSDLVDVYTAGDGLKLENNKFSIKIDADSEDYISISENGVKIEGVDNAIKEVKDSLSAYSTSVEIEATYAKTADVAATYQVKGDYALNTEMSKLLTRIEVLEKSQTNLVVASSSEDIKKITDPASTSLVLTSQDAIESLTANTTYKTLAIVGGDTEKSINIAASDSVVVDGLVINGTKDAGNGKINFTASTIELKNVEIKHGSTSYNVFESSQVTATTTGFTKNLTATNINVDDPQLTHNVINVYTPAENAQITIKDSYFNLNVANSNILRMSNYGNSKNVTITFENVDWTYENVNTSDADWVYAGLVIYQPAGADVLLSGDTSAISTWTFNFKDCRYNGEKVTSNNFGAHNQVMYMYNVGGTKTITEPTSISGLTLNFE